jgi:hypothetical protein
VSVLAMTSTRFGWIDLAESARKAGLDRLADRLRLCHVHLDTLGRKSLDRPTTHTATHDSIDLVVLKLIHGMTRPVIMMSIAVVQNRKLLCF